MGKLKISIITTFVLIIIPWHGMSNSQCLAPRTMPRDEMRLTMEKWDGRAFHGEEEREIFTRFLRENEIKVEWIKEDRHFIHQNKSGDRLSIYIPKDISTIDFIFVLEDLFKHTPTVWDDPRGKRTLSWHIKALVKILGKRDLLRNRIKRNFPDLFESQEEMDQFLERAETVAYELFSVLNPGKEGSYQSLNKVTKMSPEPSLEEWEAIENLFLTPGGISVTDLVSSLKDGEKRFQTILELYSEAMLPSVKNLALDYSVEKGLQSLGNLAVPSKALFRFPINNIDHFIESIKPNVLDGTMPTDEVLRKVFSIVRIFPAGDFFSPKQILEERQFQCVGCSALAGYILRKLGYSVHWVNVIDNVALVPESHACILVGDRNREGSYHLFDAAMDFYHPIDVSYETHQEIQRPDWSGQLNMDLFTEASNVEEGTRVELDFSPDAFNLEHQLRKLSSKKGHGRRLMKIHPRFQILPFNEGYLQAQQAHISRSYLPNAQDGNNFVIVKGDLDVSIKMEEDLIKRNGNDPFVHHSLALSYKLKGKTNEAWQEIWKALMISPTHPEFIMTAGAISEDMGAHNSATKYFKSAYDLAPDNIIAFVNYAQSLFREGKVEEMLELVLQGSKSFKKGPGRIDMLINRLIFPLNAWGDQLAEKARAQAIGGNIIEGKISLDHSKEIYNTLLTLLRDDRSVEGKALMAQLLAKEPDFLAGLERKNTKVFFEQGILNKRIQAQINKIGASA